MKIKKLGSTIFMTAALIAMVGCGAAKGTAITVVSREEGSGTRGAFIELFGVEEKNDAGEKIDNTTDEAKITNSTSVMMTTVEGDKNAIGYISTGSLSDTVKAVAIDGADPTAENIENESYKIVRAFNIAVKDQVSDAAADFIAFILSTEGQQIVEENGYIPIAGAGAYQGNAKSDKIVVAGSSSVTPVMEKIKEAYLSMNPEASIEIQQSDSTTGAQSTIDGLCDIGMLSRDLKDSELDEGLQPTMIAKDGIAVIVNKDSEINELSSEQVKAIYTGEVLNWEDLS